MGPDPKFITDILSAIGQPTRLAILQCVAPHSQGEDATGMTAGDIADTLDLAPATLAFHLKDMTFKRLLIRERHGRSVYYRADLTRLLKVLDFMVTEICGA
jgi:DNA-binding transcriptional ArsR family regulator